MENKSITRRQYRASADQRLQMVEQFRRSGLTRAAFSRQHGIPLATLSWWLTKTKRASNLPVPVVFNEVMLMPSAATPNNTWAMEVVSPSGLTVRCREALTVRDMARLLRDTRC
jgi:transposase-like protein